jgi:hypothetical protein
MVNQVTLWLVEKGQQKMAQYNEKQRKQLALDERKVELRQLLLLQTATHPCRKM